MKLTTLAAFSLLLFVGAQHAFAQAKGVDTQTQQIRNQGNGSVPRDSSGTRSDAGRERGFDFGAGKTPGRTLLQNPYRMASKRDRLLATISDLMRERNLVLDEAASRPQNGILVAQPYTFAKGAVIAQSELARYANLLEASDTAWTRGRYTLTVEVQTIDGTNNNVSVTAKVEGRSETGLGAQWSTLASSGEIENDFLSALVERVTGTSPYEVNQPAEKTNDKSKTVPEDKPQF